MNAYNYYQPNASLRQDASVQPYAYSGDSPWPNVGNETLDKLKVWFDKPTFPSSQPGTFLARVQNKHAAGAAAAVILLAATHKTWRRWLK